MPTTLSGIRRFVALLGAFVLVLALPGIALADGDETLGTPSIPIASGSGIASGGTGLEDGQPASFDVVVPVGATVKQVLLYWNGFAWDDALPGDDTMTIDGNSVTGTLIGGPNYFFNARNNGVLKGVYSSTYRADITYLGLVGDGITALTVGDLDFGRNNNGAGVVVIYDDGSAADLEIRDGNDLAFVNFGSPRNTTVPQTFTFDPTAVDRDVTLTMFAASVRSDGDERPNSVEVTVDGVTTLFDTPFQSFDGPEFDVVELTVTVPAGAAELTVQALSDDPNPSDPPDLPASFVWIGAGLVVPIPQDNGGGEGCTPGYWKQEHHFDSWEPTGLEPADDYDAVFGLAVGTTDRALLEALKAKGGKENALARHGTAALLNSLNPDVSYEYSAAEVIALVQEAYASGDFNGIKDLLEYQNELGCPLN